MARPLRTRLEVFAVEDHEIQVVWRGVPDGSWQLVATHDGRPVASHRIEGRSPVGAALLGGLPASSSVILDLVSDDGVVAARSAATTLDKLPGDELFRFATVNDVHIGASHFGTLRPFEEAEGTDPDFSIRCLRSALAQARQFGAEMVVGKGDLTHNGLAEEWETLARELARGGLPTITTLGNHDVKDGAVDGTAALGDAGIDMVGEIEVVDRPGIRIIVVNTSVPGINWGRIAHVADDVCTAAAEADTSVIVAMHHQPQRFRIPAFWPPGITGPEARPFLDQLDRAAPGTVVTTGHSHRHRRHHHGSITISEVGSTRDYPGTWAGYVVHESGIRQTVHRVAAADAISWTDPTRRVLLGVWGMWSPGLESHRSYVVRRGVPVDRLHEA